MARLRRRTSHPTATQAVAQNRSEQRAQPLAGRTGPLPGVGPEADSALATLGEMIELLECPRADLVADDFEARVERTRIDSFFAVSSGQVVERVLAKRVSANVMTLEPPAGSDVHARR